ncbi:MAG TPA: monofunctional biosynthetic peptidoglycan transglycosylase [Gammaproteobacteria bacterium]|nr:monofunctional biosynthetic peptidoglycan transglycosylase [Gammaproteobacteria bacterium]
MIRKLLRFLGCFAAFSLVLSILAVVALRWLNPPLTAFMLWDRIGNGRELHYEWVPLESISPHLRITVVAAEDQKFPNHFGFDFQSIAEALEEDRSRTRGASTITQQVAKNLFLWSGHSYARKLIEAWFAALIEICWPKQRILEIYLNIAEFGPGIYGAEAASQAFFDKPARRLNPYQSALLAAVLPNPRLMSAARPSSYVHGRAWEILLLARDLGGVKYLDSGELPRKRKLVN